MNLQLDENRMRSHLSFYNCGISQNILKINKVFIKDRYVQFEIAVCSDRKIRCNFKKKFKPKYASSNVTF